MKRIKEELLNNILPYWMNNMLDHDNGGFFGRIDGNEKLHKQADKGAVLNTRILWTFSAAYRVFKQPEYLNIAKRAFERRFQLADTIKVTGASYAHGLLNIDLVREIPEHKKPRKVSISNDLEPLASAETRIAAE